MQSSSVVNSKPGQVDYAQLMASHYISLSRYMGPVAETVVLEPVTDDVERRGLLRDSEFKSRDGWTVMNTAPIMVERGHVAWTNSYTAGLLLMDIKIDFPSVANG
jgi:hypothetical protein